MKLVYIVVAVVAVAGWLALGLFIARGPQPEIIVPAEIITTVGPLNISNTMITAWTVMAVLIIFTFLATRSMKLMPSGMQNFFEGVIAFLVDQAEEIAGEKNGRRFFMVVATIFLFVITSNWFGLLPFFNAIGKTEDVGNHIFHELAAAEPKDLTLTADGTYEESHDFASWPSGQNGGVVLVAPQTSTLEYEVHEGQTPGQALDTYIVFLAKGLADYELSEEGKEAYEAGHPDAHDVEAAFALLGTVDHKGTAAEAPRLIGGGEHADEGHGEGVHGIESPTLHQTFTGVDFEDSDKLILIIPYFRSVFSDVNNTLAMGIVAFLCIEFWGFQALGFGYLKKFFNLNGVNSFVGILELLSEFIRIISFAFRLFGNIFAGEVLILMLTFLMPFLFVDIIYGLELFVGFIQAAVFALLTLVFAVGAVEHHGDEEHDDGHDGGHADAHHPEGAVQAHR